MAKWKITNTRHIQQVGQSEPQLVYATRKTPAVVELPESFIPSKHDQFIMPVEAKIDLGKPAHSETTSRRVRKSNEPAPE
jgi:hypothetical protein